MILIAGDQHKRVWNAVGVDSVAGDLTPIIDGVSVVEVKRRIRRNKRIQVNDRAVLP